MKKQFDKRYKVIMGILLGIIFSVIAVKGFIYLCTPKFDDIYVSDLPESYMIINEANYVQFQDGLDCGGYATAYVLRHLGEEIEGEALYPQMSYKVGRGVSLRGIRKAFRDYGYHAVSYTGTIDTMKMQLMKGNPIVAFVTINEDGEHYVAVVGWDKNFIYLADSTGSASNTVGCFQYNRRVTYEQFEKLWQTHSYPVQNIYTVVELAGR
ncbi:MAG: C39 family peptidase [Lachnospiraceae bacterium]|nr:C39 family peptidase [Lachnospiraceae bacterium]